MPIMGGHPKDDATRKEAIAMEALRNGYQDIGGIRGYADDRGVHLNEHDVIQALGGRPDAEVLRDEKGNRTGYRLRPGT